MRYKNFDGNCVAFCARLYEKYNYISKGNNMNLLFILIERYFLWIALAVLLMMLIYRIAFHIPVPAFNEEAIKNLMAK